MERKDERCITPKCNRRNNLKKAQAYLLEKGEKQVLRLHTTPAIYKGCMTCSISHLCEQNKGN